MSVYVSHVYNDQEKCINLKVCNVKVSLCDLIWLSNQNQYTMSMNSISL